MAWWPRPSFPRNRHAVRKNLVDNFGNPLFWRQSAFNEHAHTGADEIAVGTDRMRCKAVARQHAVSRIGEIGQGVEQGSVEVKDNALIV